MRLLTLDDLCDYYSNHKNIVRYNAEKNDDTPVVIQLPGVMTFSEDDYDPEMSLLKTHLKSCHIGTNRNHSNIEQSVMEQATPSIYNRPILGFIHKLSDDTYDFAGHEMFINDDGEIEYEEIPVGCIPESGNAHLVYDKENDKTYLEVDGLIYEEYTRAADILKEKKESKVSVELALLDYAYNPKNKEMVINRFYFSGITILGKDRNTEEPIEEGMYGSKVTLQDFKKHNSFCSNYTNISDTEVEVVADELKEKMIEMRDSINVLLSRFNINQVEKSENSIENKEEGGLQTLTKFEELLEKYNKTIDDITFETDGLSDEELESKFAEVFEKSEDSVEDETEETEEIIVTEDSKKTDGGEVDEKETSEDSDESTEEDSEKTDDTTDESGEDNGSESEEENSGETTDDSSEGESDDDSDSSDSGESDDGYELIERTFEFDGRKFSISFELSHEDIRCALYNLIVQYEEIDNDWYGIRAVYDDYFAYQGWFSGKIYGQKYTKDGDTVALDGERYSLHEELLTDSELAQLNEMRSNYSSIQTELNSYKEAESYADKMTIFDDVNYTQFLETPEFKELMKKENVLKYTKEELEDKADIAFSKLVKRNKTFALDTKSDKKKSANGFAFGKLEKKSTFLDGLLNQNKANQN